MRFRAKSDGVQVPDKWLRLADVPDPLVTEWRTSRRKDGTARKRSARRQQDPAPLPDSDVEKQEDNVVIPRLDVPVNQLLHARRPFRKRNSLSSRVIRLPRGADRGTCP